MHIRVDALLLTVPAFVTTNDSQEESSILAVVHLYRAAQEDNNKSISRMSRFKQEQKEQGTKIVL